MWMYSLLFLLFILGASAAQPFDGEHHPQDLDVHSSEDTRRWMGDLNSVLGGMSDPDSKALIDDMEDGFNGDWNDNRVLHFAPKVNCDPTITTCLSFLNELTKSVASRNSTDIRKHFSESFHFKGCRDPHFFDEVVAKLSEVPVETGFFSILDSQRNYRNEFIQFNASLHGVFSRPFSAEFVLSKKTATLLEGRDIECLIL